MQYLLHGIAEIVPGFECVVGGICIDSRELKAGDAFLACAGSRTSGVNYIKDAIAKGASIILTDAGAGLAGETLSVPLIHINGLRDKAGIIASRFFGEPSRDLNVIGVTGTNGKTSVAHFIGQVLSRHQDSPAGYIGTLGLGRADDLRGSKNTTPDPVTIHRTLADLKAQGVRDVIMEVSSHALDQGRVSGVDFNVAVFTGLSRDHLDYHGDMQGYAEAKKKLFLSEGLKFGVINADDAYGKELVESLQNRIEVISYGIVENNKSNAGTLPRVGAAINEQALESLSLNIFSPWGEGELTAGLTGRFNVYNLLAVLSVSCLSGLSFSQVLRYLSSLDKVPGRMELFSAEGSARVFVDYAHTPDALAQVLSGLRDQCRGKLICVFGCGGDRDQGKRPEMGRVAGEYADHVVLTNDNPRSEPPEKIIHEILDGMPPPASVQVESDRARAIEMAIKMAAPDDIILVAGKGHETYQEIGGRRYPFSDRQLVRNLLERKK